MYIFPNKNSPKVVDVQPMKKKVVRMWSQENHDRRIDISQMPTDGCISRKLKLPAAGWAKSVAVFVPY